MEASGHNGAKARRELARYSDLLPASPVFSVQPEHVFTWEQVVRVLRKNARFSAIFAAILTSGVALAVYSMKNVYQPVARLQIDPVNSGIRTLPEIEETRGADTLDYLETQAQILRSDALAVSVIRSMHLASNPEFVGKSDLAKFAGQADTADQAKRLPVSDSSFLQEQFDLADRTAVESIALEAFHQRLTVNPVRNSRLIEVSFVSPDPQLARLVTNALVTQFIDQNFRHRYASTMQTSEWLSTQLNDLRRTVEEANQAVTDYQKRYGLVETDDRDVPLGQLMNEVNHQLSDAQANRIEAEAYVRMIDLGQSETIPAVRDNALYQNLMTQYADARAQLAQARTIYGDESTNVKKLENQANELGAQVEAERARMVNRIRTSFAAARERESMMMAAREKLKAQMGDASSHMVAFRLLRNEAMARAELYNTLQGRLKEAGIYAGLRSSNISVVDLAAKLPKPTGPHRRLMIGAGAMVSCFLAVVLAFVRESFENTVRTPDDVKDWTGLPSLGMIPTIGQFEEATKRPLPYAARLTRLEYSENGQRSLLKSPLMKSHTAEAEAIRDLRTSLLFSKLEAPPRVILVSSSSANEGKTTVALNLAVALAQRGRTCLVESDLRRSTLSDALGLSCKTGLSQVLSGTVPLDAALASVSEIPNLSVLPSGPLVRNPEMLIDSGQMQAVLIAVSEQFDYVVIDSPPVIPFSDARVLSTYADAVVLVGRYGLTTRRSITRCAQILEEVRAPVFGVVLNDIGLASPDYHYYNYGYSRSMRGRLQYYGYAENGHEPCPPLPETDPVKKKGAHA